MPIKNRQQLLIIVAGAVFGLLIADALILSPLTKSWQARSKRITELRKQVDDGEKLLKRADALKSRWEQMQKNALPNALSQALSYATNGYNYLNAGTAGARYTTWFGTYDSSRYSTVKSHFANIKSALGTQPIAFDCSCTESGTYAYVYPTQPYKIYVCGAFWSAPNAGTDSRGGTIVHETSHFDVVANTDDLAYGQTAAKSLARKSPTKAIRNADSHEYFGENTPAQN